VHDLVGAFDEHGDYVWALGGLEDEASDAPFEVAHAPVGVLMYHSFREDVDPTVGITGVSGRSEVLPFIVEAGRIRGCGTHVGEGIDAVSWPGVVKVI